MPLLSVIMPVYNEKNTILKIIEKVRAVNIDKEIVIVDDCSNDGTVKILLDIDKILMKSDIESIEELSI